MATAVQLVEIPLPSTSTMPGIRSMRVYNRDSNGKRVKLESEKEPSKWDRHQFICYDGEGYDINGNHQYVYLCAYNGNDYRDIRNDEGLGTLQCLQFLTETARAYKYGINVIYGGSYDANMMLRDLPRVKLEELHQDGSCIWEGYYIEYVARKYFQVAKLGNKKLSMRLWDVIGFFQDSFINSLRTWLDLNDKTIDKGKKSRHAFNAEQLDFIIAYCQKELYLFEKLMQRLWSCLDAAGIKLNRWDGAGAAAAYLLKSSGVLEYKGSAAIQAQHYHLARYAYAGGRFELIRPGDYQCPVYNYDINSAYPYGMTQLPEFTGLVECSKKNHNKCVIGKYDMVKIDYDEDIMAPFHPYFHRDDYYNVSFPHKHKGWHWAPEYLMAKKYGMQGNVVLHYRLYDNKQRPFTWISTLYDKRKALKAVGDKAEYALKLALNALYGKMVQQKGWHPGESIPKTHQLYWGGWVTSYTRSMIFDAMMQKPESVIGVETDGIFTTEKLDLPLGDGLGQWGVSEYQSMTYVQNGLYFLTTLDGKEITKYRGIDKGSLKREAIYKGWARQKGESGPRYQVKATLTRFRTIGTSLVGKRLPEWRQWITEKKVIDIYMTKGKRRHWTAHPDYGKCACWDKPYNERWGKGLSHTTVCTAPTNAESNAYNVLWDDTKDKKMFYEQMAISNESIIIEE